MDGRSVAQARHWVLANGAATVSRESPKRRRQRERSNIWLAISNGQILQQEFEPGQSGGVGGWQATSRLACPKPIRPPELGLDVWRRKILKV